jgi:hypothetical protein
MGESSSQQREVTGSMPALAISPLLSVGVEEANSHGAIPIH